MEELITIADKINFNAILNWKTLSIFLELFLLIILTTIILKIVDNAANRLFNVLKRSEYDLLFVRFFPLITKLIRLIIILLVLIILANLHNINLTSIIAGLGIGGLAIGFAAKETIADVFGTVCLLADRVFKIGDYIEVDKAIAGNDLAGTIEDINFRSSRIRSIDGSLNIIPNHILAASIIKNTSLTNRRCISEELDITYDTPIEKVKEAIEICRNILKNNQELSNDYTVELKSLSASSLKIMIRAFTVSKTWDDLQRIRNNVLLEIFQTFNTAKIEFAFTTQTLYLKQL